MNFGKATITTISFLLLATGACGGEQPQVAAQEVEPAMTDAKTRPAGIIDHTVESLAGESVDLGSYRGRPMLIVNTASKCGYTPQYEGLQKLYERYGMGDLVVIGFPSNDFGNQEPAPELARMR